MHTPKTRKKLSKAGSEQGWTDTRTGVEQQNPYQDPLGQWLVLTLPEAVTL